MTDKCTGYNEQFAKMAGVSSQAGAVNSFALAQIPY